MTPFFDTNIVVYAFLDVARRERALDLIASGGVISAQVLNEFTNVARLAGFLDELTDTPAA